MLGYGELDVMKYTTAKVFKGEDFPRPAQKVIDAYLHEFGTHSGDYQYWTVGEEDGDDSRRVDALLIEAGARPGEKVLVSPSW